MCLFRVCPVFFFQIYPSETGNLEDGMLQVWNKHFVKSGRDVFVCVAFVLFAWAETRFGVPVYLP